MDKIEFQFVIYKVQNLANGGYRVALDIPSVHAKEAAVLLVRADAPGIIGRARITLGKNEDIDQQEDDYGL